MKKCLGLVISVIITTILVGSIVCLVEPTKVVAGNSPDPVLAFDFVTHGDAGDPYWAVMVKGAKDASAALGCDFIFHYNPSDIPGQVSTLETCLASSDGIAVVASDSEAFDDGIQAALDAGLPIVQVDTADMEWEPKGVPFIGCMPWDEGYAQGTYIASVIKVKGLTNVNVLVNAEDIGAIYAVKTRDGFLDALTDAGIEYTHDYLGVTNDAATALGHITGKLEGDPSFNVIFGCGGISTEAGIKAVQAVGRSPGEVLVSGVDLLPGTIEGLKNGYATSSTTKQQYLMGYYSVVQLYQQAKFGFAALPMHIIPKVVTPEIIADVEALAEKRYY